MINLKKVFRRKKAQGALEYLFMIAAALIIIFVVVRYISQSGGQASQQGDIATLQSQAELVKTNLQAKGFWDDDYVVITDNPSDPTKLQIVSVSDSSTTIIAEDDNLEYYGDEVPADYLGTDATGAKDLKDLYESCTKDNDEDACMILIDLQDAKRPSS